MNEIVFIFDKKKKGDNFYKVYNRVDDFLFRSIREKRINADYYIIGGKFSGEMSKMLNPQKDIKKRQLYKPYKDDIKILSKDLYNLIVKRLKNDEDSCMINIAKEKLSHEMIDKYWVIVVDMHI